MDRCDSSICHPLALLPPGRCAVAVCVLVASLTVITLELSPAGSSLYHAPSSAVRPPTLQPSRPVGVPGHGQPSWPSLDSLGHSTVATGRPLRRGPAEVPRRQSLFSARQPGGSESAASAGALGLVAGVVALGAVAVARSTGRVPAARLARHPLYSGADSEAEAVDLGALPSDAGARPRIRWFMDLSKWSPSASEREFLINLLPRQGQSGVRGIDSEAERDRAVAHEMLQRAAITAALGIPWQSIQLGKAEGGAGPALLTPRDTAGAENFNFAVIDKGDYVLVATENSYAVDVPEICEMAAELGLVEKEMADLVPQVAQMGYEITVEAAKQEEEGQG